VARRVCPLAQFFARLAKMNWYRKRNEKLNFEEDHVRGGLLSLALATQQQGLPKNNASFHYMLLKHF